MKTIAAYTPTTLCIFAAGWIVVARGPDADGWGWFLVVAVLLIPSWTSSGNPRH